MRKSPTGEGICNNQKKPTIALQVFLIMYIVMNSACPLNKAVPTLLIFALLIAQLAAFNIFQLNSRISFILKQGGVDPLVANMRKNK